MGLPAFDDGGDLPVGIHRASLEEVVERFGLGSDERRRCTRNLVHIYELAKRTGHLERFVVFGSYVTDKQAPNDVDVILVMDDGFVLEKAALEARGLFDHAIAAARYGASIFWLKPSVLIGEKLDGFLTYWQTKRDGSLRGIVEIAA
jgi:predicted nucleotidyltransferase